MLIKPVSSSCPQSVGTHSFSRSGTLVGGDLFCYWRGYAKLAKGTSATELPIITPSTQRGIPDKVGLKLPGTAVVLSSGIKVLGDVSIGTSATANLLNFIPFRENGNIHSYPVGVVPSLGSTVQLSKSAGFFAIPKNSHKVSITLNNFVPLESGTGTTFVDYKVMGSGLTVESPTPITASPTEDLIIQVFISFVCPSVQRDGLFFVFPSESSFFDSAPQA
jgi:hypothetical protein